MIPFYREPTVHMYVHMYVPSITVTKFDLVLVLRLLGSSAAKAMLFADELRNSFLTCKAAKVCANESEDDDLDFDCDMILL